MSEGLSAQRGPALHCQDAINEAKTETEAVMLVLVKPERQKGHREEDEGQSGRQERETRGRSGVPAPGRVPHGSTREAVQILVPLCQQVEHIGSD